MTDHADGSEHLMLQSEPWLAEVLNRSILVTGAPRSGTTLLGRLLHSCEGVEYVFEPKTVLPMLALINSIDEANWRTLFETTLVAEAMMDRVAGRAINLNPHDDSYFGAAKGGRGKPAWQRLDHSWSATDAQEACEHRVLVWKSPEAGMWAADLMRLYPGMRVVAIWRSEEDVVRSMVKKGWFAHHQEVRWFHGPEGTPFWWHRSSPGEGLWWDLSEAEKASALWASIWAGLGEDVYVVDYADLCREPQIVFAALCGFLGLEEGPMTGRLLREIRKEKE